MEYPYPLIPGTVPISPSSLPDPVSQDGGALPPALLSPPMPTRGSKSIFAFWHAGVEKLPPYLLRNVLVWYRRLAPVGWNIYVLDTVPGSPLNASRFLDTSSPSVMPKGLIEGGIDGTYISQATSDLIRFPLLLKYGGVYLDVGVLQFGDLNWLWETHIANPSSPYDFAGLTMGSPPDAITIVNFVIMAVPDCPLILRAHKIYLKIWEGRTNTSGTHKHPLVSHVPLMQVPSNIAVGDDGKDKMVINDEAMTDYAIHIQTLGAAQRWLDEANGWDGPRYVREKCWLYSMMDMAYVNEQKTQWNSRRQFDLFSLRLPGPDDGEETPDQKLARDIVETSIRDSWCLKLAHGFSAKLFGAPTLGMLWRDNPGSDCVEGTYAGWLRWAQLNCTQAEHPKSLEIPVYEPTMVATLED